MSALPNVRVWTAITMLIILTVLSLVNLKQIVILCVVATAAEHTVLKNTVNATMLVCSVLVAVTVVIVTIKPTVNSNRSEERNVEWI